MILMTITMTMILITLLKKNPDNNVKISYPDPDTIIMMKTMIIRPCACMQIFF